MKREYFVTFGWHRLMLAKHKANDTFFFLHKYMKEIGIYFRNEILGLFAVDVPTPPLFVFFVFG